MISAHGEGWRLEIGTADNDANDFVIKSSAIEHVAYEQDSDEWTTDHLSLGDRHEDELVYGQYETVKIPINSLVRLPQVRSGLNPDLPDLKESIKTNGLLNP